MSKFRLDKLMTLRGLVRTRSQAESWIKLGKVTVDGKTVTKPGFFAEESSIIKLDADEQYVSRAGLKLASVADKLGVKFDDKIVLDVGSSTGGFTDYALQHGAKKVIAVDVGTDQLHPSLKNDDRIELHEKTDIRGFRPSATPDIVVIDVSFVSLKDILPSVRDISDASTIILAMAKPQFEATGDQRTHSGIIKNNRVRREILKDFELWAKQLFSVRDKADSGVKGAGGNEERFYYLVKTNR